jgi:hypothetical protein
VAAPLVDAHSATCHTCLPNIPLLFEDCHNTYQSNENGWMNFCFIDSTSCIYSYKSTKLVPHHLHLLPIVHGFIRIRTKWWNNLFRLLTKVREKRCLKSNICNSGSPRIVRLVLVRLECLRLSLSLMRHWYQLRSIATHHLKHMLRRRMTMHRLQVTIRPCQ